MPVLEPVARPETEAVLEGLSEAVYVVDRARRITFWNPAAEQLTGFGAEEVIGRRCQDALLDHVDDEGRPLCGSRCPLARTMFDGQPREANLYLHHHDGHRVPIAVRAAPLRGPDGAITGAVEAFHDDGDRRGLGRRLLELEGRLVGAEQQAMTDELTGLANRRMLEGVLRRHDEDYRRYGHKFSVLFADIDRFKDLNDHYGHQFGDDVIRSVAATLANCIRAGDTVGRWGGDEFVIVAGSTDELSASRLADRVRRLVASSWALHDGRRIGVTVTVGVAHAGSDGWAAAVGRADSAMLEAKRQGGDRSAVASGTGWAPQPDATSGSMLGRTAQAGELSSGGQADGDRKAVMVLDPHQAPVIVLTSSQKGERARAALSSGRSPGQDSPDQQRREGH